MDGPMTYRPLRLFSDRRLIGACRPVRRDRAKTEPAPNGPGKQGREEAAPGGLVLQKKGGAKSTAPVR